jgi:transposase
MLPRHAISDADWDRIKHLLPNHGPEGNRRRFVDAVLWVARTGAAWADLPPRFGNPNGVWKRFDRWARSGVWVRLFEALQDPDVEWLILDSTVVRAHPNAAGARKKRAVRPGSASGAVGAGSAPKCMPR